MDVLGDPMDRAAVDFCTLLPSFSIALTAQFTRSHVIFKSNDPDQITSPPQHLDGGKEPSRLRWDNQELRRMRMGGEALFIWLLRLWSEWEGTSAFPEGWRPVLTDLLNASPWNWGLGNPSRAIWGKGAGACKARRTLQSLKCTALNQRNDSSVQCLLIVPSDSAPNSGN